MAVQHTYKWMSPGVSNVGSRTEALTPMKAIRRHCAECYGFCMSWQKEVESCLYLDCALYPFRLGKNPSLKGIRRGCSRAKSAQIHENDNEGMSEYGDEGNTPVLGT